MNHDLADLIVKYAISPHKEIATGLYEKSKDNVIAILMDLLANYFNDKNSSSLREFVIVSLAGFEINHEKIGYNGYRQGGIGGGTLYCEAKPKNINSNDERSRKLDGGANFTDYTWERFKRDKKANPTMILGGFIDGKLIYTLQFPFTTQSFLDRLQSRLEAHFPDGDVRSQYLRSANFGLTDYQSVLNKESVKLFVDKADLDKMSRHITKNLCRILHHYGL